MVPGGEVMVGEDGGKAAPHQQRRSVVPEECCGGDRMVCGGSIFLEHVKNVGLSSLSLINI